MANPQKEKKERERLRQMKNKCAFLGEDAKCLSKSSPRKVCTLSLKGLPLKWCRAYQALEEWF